MALPRITTVAAVALAALTLVACGDDAAGSPTVASTSPAVPVRPSTTTVPPVAPTTTVRPVTPTTTDGGGGMSAGAPSFQTFDVSSPVPCQAGNADATMSYTTLNVVDIKIKIGSTGFEETAGYGPDETAVIASIPCTGPGTSVVQLRGCTEDGQCADSPARDVTITG